MHINILQVNFNVYFSSFAQLSVSCKTVSVECLLNVHFNILKQLKVQRVVFNIMYILDNSIVRLFYFIKAKKQLQSVSLLKPFAKPCFVNTLTN